MGAWGWNLFRVCKGHKVGSWMDPTPPNLGSLEGEPPWSWSAWAAEGANRSGGFKAELRLPAGLLGWKGLGWGGLAKAEAQPSPLCPPPSVCRKGGWEATKQSYGDHAVWSSVLLDRLCQTREAYCRAWMDAEQHSHTFEVMAPRPPHFATTGH